MNIKVVVHPAEEGGYWAEVPSLPGCVSQGETMDELMVNIKEAINGCMLVDIDVLKLTPEDKILDIAI